MFRRAGQAVPLAKTFLEKESKAGFILGGSGRNGILVAPQQMEMLRASIVLFQR